MPDPVTLFAQAHGDKLAVVDDRPDGRIDAWDFNTLEANSNRLAHVLLGLGVDADSKIVWCGQNSCWLVAMTVAIRKLGAVSVPLNYRLTPEEATYVVDNSDAEIVFTDAQYAGLFEQIRPDTPQVEHVLVFDGAAPEGMTDAHALLDAASDQPPGVEPEAGRAASMIYTSGTTGKPKGAYRTSSGRPEQQGKLLEFIGYTPDDVYITTGPLYHSGPLGFMGFSLAMGQTIVLQNKYDAEDWLRLVEKYRVTSTFAAPTPIRRVCQLDSAVISKYERASMRLMVANAAPWSFALKKMYLEHFPAESLYEVYGSTELGINTVLEPEHQLTKPGSCGKPAPGVELFLFDDEGNLITEPHQPGELFIRSGTIFQTYYKAEEKFEADRRDDKQTVGDIAYFDEEGFYYICDRKKDMIISGGVNIYPAEIEAALESHDDIMDVAVFGIPDEEWGEVVHATLVKRPGSDVDAEAVQAYGREHLAGYKVPRSVEFIDEIPRTGSGKTLKRQLREPYWKDYNTQV
ncbi:MAG: AMP-binding protein [Gammaproteobacteria bacterium AqS3]|nr:AMP-binding protein [Gammaproteobacteria bacterium AqS3]